VKPVDAFQRQVVVHDLDWLASSYPAMADLVELYRQIDRLQAEIAGAVNREQVSVVPPNLENGRPALESGQFFPEEEQLAGWVSAMHALMAQYGVQAGANGEEADESLSPADLLAAAQEGFRQQATPTGGPFAGSLTRLALGQVVAGILRGATRLQLDALDTAGWQRGYCPVCGGWPDMGTLDANANTQTLICSRCDAMWPYRRVGCPFCATDDDIQFYASSDEKVRVSVCGVCGAYLKQVRLPLSASVQSLPGLRLLTVGQDLDAQAAGWGRPPTRQ
jgi:formate dehydrogenase maturation protein FdhE